MEFHGLAAVVRLVVGVGSERPLAPAGAPDYTLRAMGAVPKLRMEEMAAQVDQRTYLHNVSWAQYESLLAMRGDRSAPRIAYLEGEVEIMSPSRPHERTKTKIARLLEAWGDATGTRIEGVGSETIRSEPEKRGIEPDECYLVGDHEPDVPDLAIEVVWTSGMLDKLEIYRRLGVREVWVWRNDRIEIHVLRGERYERRHGSEVLPKLDMKLLLRCLDEPDQFSAVRALRSALRRKGK